MGVHGTLYVKSATFPGTVRSRVPVLNFRTGGSIVIRPGSPSSGYNSGNNETASGAGGTVDFLDEGGDVRLQVAHDSLVINTPVIDLTAQATTIQIRDNETSSLSFSAEEDPLINFDTVSGVVEINGALSVQGTIREMPCQIKMENNNY